MKKEYQSPTWVCRKVCANDLICTSTIPAGGTADNGEAQAGARGTTDWDNYEK